MCNHAPVQNVILFRIVCVPRPDHKRSEEIGYTIDLSVALRYKDALGAWIDVQRGYMDHGGGLYNRHMTPVRLAREFNP